MVVGATANLSGGKITENEVSFSGGGICALYDANVNISDDMEISNNTSVAFGGGIYASNAIINIDGGKIFGNSTTMGGAAGGAIYIDNARNNTSITSLDISGGEIFDNTTDLNYGNAIAIGYGNNINFNLKGSPEIKGEIVFFTDGVTINVTDNFTPVNPLEINNEVISEENFIINFENGVVANPE